MAAVSFLSSNQGATWEKGILEQSEITLVSVSDESMLGPDTTVPEDEGQVTSRMIYRSSFDDLCFVSSRFSCFMISSLRSLT